MGSAGETSQTDGEGDGPDKPSPSDMPKKLESLKTSHPYAVAVNGANSYSTPATFPLPPADSLLMGLKQPGLTRGALQKLTLSTSSTSSSDQHNMQHCHPSPTSPSPVPTSPTDSAPPSRGPSRPPSQPASRAPSMSAGKSGGKVQIPPMADGSGRERRGSQANDYPPSTPLNRRPPSVHSDKSEGGHKFNLRDLLANGPKLNRKSSQRSTSSRRSDSDTEGKPRSVTGDSTVSMSQKYGVCQKIAIGKGATSVVRLAHKWDRSEEKLYAIKEFRKRRKNETEKEYVKKLTAEFCISSTLHHTNVVETVDLIQDENQHWCEVMEFCPGGDLYAAIKKGGMSPSEVECCFKQILNGVAYLHSQGVAHRDIKPENLFFDTKGHLKIGDYGASTVYRLPWEATVHMSTGLCGSEPYIAPEQFLGKRKP